MLKQFGLKRSPPWKKMYWTKIGQTRQPPRSKTWASQIQKR
jgi:hypothetical protein